MGRYGRHVCTRRHVRRGHRGGCRTTVNLPFEPHLMVAHPERHIGRLTQADYQTIIVHAEATSDIGSVINPPVDLSTPPIKPHQADRMTQ